MILKHDCIHFPGDRPCKFNKLEGRICTDCNDYVKYEPAKKGFRVLIIKLDALGDVLRTTSILPAVKKMWPQSSITWVTKSNSVPVFKNIEMVDEVIVFEDTVEILKIAQQYFDVVIHPDASPQSASLATLVGSYWKHGFVTDINGKVIPADDKAEEWFEMGAFDHLKKANTKTYQQVIHEIAGFPYKKGEIQLKLDDEELKLKQNFINKHSLGETKYLLGINVGASGRWQLKQWRMDGFVELIRYLYGIVPGLDILLYGGREEVERISELTAQFPQLISTGTDNDLRTFFALLDIPQVVISGDTMALHAATALRKKVICLFGPTSYNEIEDYGRITKIYPQMDCLVCYKPTCDFKPNCMELISTQMVLDAVLSAFGLGLA
jgi:heptosyltransferase-2